MQTDEEKAEEQLIGQVKDAMAKMPDAGSAAIAKHLNLDQLDVELAMNNIYEEMELANIEQITKAEEDPKIQKNVARGIEGPDGGPISTPVKKNPQEEEKKITQSAAKFLMEYGKTKRPSTASKDGPPDPEGWLKEKIQIEKDKVGGLLSDEGAVMVLARERGWSGIKEEFGVEELTPLDEDGLDAEYKMSDKGYINIVTIVKDVGPILRPGNPEFEKAQCAVKVTDGRNFKIITFKDHLGKDGASGNFLCSLMQQIWPGVKDKKISVRVKGFQPQGKKGIYLGTTLYSKFKVLD
jgi:hypothetical protein